MSDKDVRLVVKAKNEASRNLDAVKSSLDGLRKSQDGLVDSSQSTSSVLKSVGSNFQKLKNEIAALGALSKVSATIERASKALGRLEDDARRSSNEIERYSKSLADSESKAEALQKSSLENAKALQSEIGVLKRLRDERAKANAEARSVARKIVRVDTSLASASPAEIPNFQNQRNLLSTQAADSAAKVQQSNAALSNQKKIVDGLRKSSSDLQKNIRSNVDEQSRFKQAIVDSTAALERNNAKVATAKAELAEIRAIGNQAATALGNIALSQEEVAAATSRANSELAKSGAVLAAVSRFSNGGGGFTDTKTAESLRRQREEIAKAEAAWNTLEAEVKQAAIAMRSTEAPTQAQVSAFNQLVAASRAAKQETNSLKVGLAQLQGSLRSSYSEWAKTTGQIKVFSAEAKRAGQAVSEAKTKFGLKGIFAPFYGESRQALSYMQRIRGELLSMAAAYTGLYGVIQNSGAAVKAFQALEAAQNRLGVAFNQDQGKIAGELNFLNDTAKRLGISFEVLADRYSKFAVAGKTANFSDEAVRSIFTSVAEAGRVNKLSAEDMRGVFLALEQMISKGKISAEELRQQLGERLPGAFAIMASALGVSTAKLDKMMESGEVLSTQSNLIKFADELNRRFGPQLEKSLDSTTTKIGRFQNEIFQAQLRFAKGGFIDGLNEALDELSKWFDSQEGRQFFTELGASAGQLVRVIAVMPKYFDLIGDAIQALIAWKLAQVFLGIGAAATKSGATLTNFKALLGSVSTGVSSLATTYKSMGAAATVTAGSVKVLTGSLGFLKLALRAFPGAAIFLAIEAAISLILGKLASFSSANVDVEEHNRIVNAMAVAYNKVGKEASKAAGAIEGVTKIDAERNFIKQAESLSALKKELSAGAIEAIKPSGAGPFGIIPDFGLLESSVKKQLRSISEAFVNGETDVTKYREELAKLNDASDDLDLRKQIQELDALVVKYEEQNKVLGESALAAKTLGSTMGEVQKAAQDTGVKLEDFAAKATEASSQSETGFEGATESLEAYSGALGEIKDQIPGLSEELKKLQELAKLDAAYQSAVNTAISMGQVQQATALYNQAKASISDKYTNYEAKFTAERGTPRGAQMEELVRATNMLAQQMQVSAKDLLTIMSYETGGTLDPWKRGPTTQWGQHRGLIQWGEPQQKKYGVSAESSITQQVMAMGKYFSDAGVKAGDSLLQLYAAVNAGNAKKIYASDANNGGAPGTVLDKVSNQMEGHKNRAAGLLASYQGVTLEVEKQVEANTRAKEQEEERKKKAEEDAASRREAVDQQKSDLDFQISQEELIAQKKERQAFVEEALRNAKQANKDISQSELDLIAQKAGKLFDIQHAEDASNAAKESAKAAEEEVNRLLEYRQTLMEQMAIYKEQGDGEALARTQAELDGINQKLTEAIANAQAMNNALGGPGADLANAKLNTTALNIDKVADKALISGQQISDMLVDGLGSMFNEFAQAVANGENAVDAFKRAFLKMAAQFLIQIGQMIVKQALLNALSGMTGGAGGGGGGGGGGFLGFFGSLFGARHEGGVVGDDKGMARFGDPAWFRNAIKLHKGGMPQLANNEVPTILTKDEEVLTSDDPRHVNNGGKSPAGGKMNVKVVNTIDAGSFISSGLNSKQGEEAIMNWLSANSGTVRSSLGI